jgi:hypothetical protein
MQIQSESGIALQSLGDFWCEAAVLVAVLGPLERVLRQETLTLAWIAPTGGSAMMLFATGTLMKIGAVKWTNP